MDLLAAQALWDAQPGWLNTASYGLPPRPAYEAVRAAMDDWRVGRASWEPWDACTGQAREAFARLVGVDANDVAVGSAVSQLLAPVSASLRPRTRVLVPEVEFTSNLFPWLAAPGVDVVTVPLHGFVERIDASVDVVACSLVQSADGAMVSYPDLVAAAREVDALVVIDATQACGWLPLDASLADVVAVAGYKWLMAPRGCAFAYLSPAARERLVPHAAGWYAGEDVYQSFYGPPLRLAKSARRFDISPAWFSYVGAVPALNLIEQIGVAAIGEHNVGLANRFLTALGQPPGESAIVTVDVPGAEERLAAAGVRAAVRAGRVRASFHVYTTESDVDCAVEALTR